jgi:hypothetical protein
MSQQQPPSSNQPAPAQPAQPTQPTQAVHTWDRNHIRALIDARKNTNLVIFNANMCVHIQYLTKNYINFM